MRVVLIHGGWGTASVWGSLIPALADRGIDSAAVDLPGRGSDRRRGWRVSLSDYGDAINDACEGEPAILVGHSAGGVAMTQAACSTPVQHAALIYLTAFLPADGERLAQLARRGVEPAMAEKVKVDPLRGVLRLSSAGLEEILYHDYTGDDLDGLLQRRTPEPLRPGLARVRLNQRFDATPKFYIQCARDRSISPSHQQWMCSRYGIDASAVLDTGHMPMHADPDGLADALATIVQGLGHRT